MNFREVTENDISALIELRGKTRENPYSIKDLANIGITQESIAIDLKKDLKGFLCEIDNKIVGFAMGKKNTGEMWVIAVLPEYEKMGIGGKLLSLIENWLFDNNCSELWLTTGNNPQKRAYGFYINQGWTPSEVLNHLRYMRKKRS